VLFGCAALLPSPAARSTVVESTDPTQHSLVSPQGRADGTYPAPFSQFPVLVVDGKPLGQSASILRYVAKLAGLVPSDAFEAAVAESQLDQVMDILASMYVVGTTPEAERAAAAEKYGSERVPKLTQGLIAYLGDKLFFGGETPNYVDFALYALLEGAKRYGINIVAAAPGGEALQRLFDAVAAHPKLAAHFAKRAEVEAAEAAAAKAAASN
jgi:glutathione S-transferase